MTCTFPNCKCNLENNGRHQCKRHEKPRREEHSSGAMEVSPNAIQPQNTEGSVLEDLQTVWEAGNRAPYKVLR